MLNLGDGILRNEHQIARPQGGNFAQTLFSEHLLYVEDARLHPIIIYMAEEHDLRMLRLMSESARDLHGLDDRSVRAQFVFPGMSHLSAGNKVRMLELLECHGHLRVVEISAVRLSDGYLKLVKRQPVGGHGACILQKDITIGLDDKDLIELGRQGKAEGDYIASVEPVERTASSKLEVSHAVRLPRFCSRRSIAPRAGPGLAGLGRLYAMYQDLSFYLVLGDDGHAKLRYQQAN